jgi:hypothetical protein
MKSAIAAVGVSIPGNGIAITAIPGEGSGIAITAVGTATVASMAPAFHTDMADRILGMVASFLIPGHP